MVAISVSTSIQVIYQTSTLFNLYDLVSISSVATSISHTTGHNATCTNKSFTTLLDPKLIQGIKSSHELVAESLATHIPDCKTASSENLKNYEILRPSASSKTALKAGSKRVNFGSGLWKRGFRGGGSGHGGRGGSGGRGSSGIGAGVGIGYLIGSGNNGGYHGGGESGSMNYSNTTQTTFRSSNDGLRSVSMGSIIGVVGLLLL